MDQTTSIHFPTLRRQIRLYRRRFFMSPAPYVTAAVATAGVLGTAYVAYQVYQHKFAVKPVKLPETWTKVGKLSAMYIYPVKSCIPVVPETAETSVLGLRQDWCRDRTLVVIDKKNNFVTSRQQAELFRVEPTFKGSVLTLKHPDVEPISINLAEVAESTKKIDATVWGVKVKVVDCGLAAQKFFSQILDKSLDSFRLVYWPNDKARGMRGTTGYAGVMVTKNDPGAFPDETAYNIVNEASVEDLNTRLATDKVSHRNFRPTLVVSGPKPYDEDNWRFIKIGESVFQVLKPCLRCVMTTMDPETGVRSPNREPVKTLESYRITEDPELRRRIGSAPRMGLQMALRAGAEHTITLNDDIYVA